MANEIQIYFKATNLASGVFTISDVSIKESKSVKLYDIPRSEGSVAETAKRKSLTISLKGEVSGTDYDDLRTNLDTLKAILQDGLQKFTMDDDRYVYAQLQNFDYTYITLRTLARVNITFIAHYPFWLAESESTDTQNPPTSGVGYTVNNPGNAPTRVKIKVTAPVAGIADNCQIENQTTGELFRYRGTIANGKILEVDNRYDSDDYEVLNDGDDDHTNFEGDFITLDPGNNTIVYTGTAGAKVEIFYRGAYY